MRSKGRLSAALERALDATLQPVLPWQAILARFLASHARDDYSFHRLSRRGGDALLPSLRSQQTNLVIVIDNSGSISDAELNEFITEIDALQMPEQWVGGGGTRITPVFDWVANQGPAPDALIYFTDAMGEFPQREPGYPVLWLVKGRGKVPWGMRVQLNS